MGRGWVHGHRVVAAAQKGKVFTKIAKEIAVAVKMGGSDPDSNPRLRLALRDAQKNSMPKDTIERAIKRGSGSTDESELMEMLYEGFGPHKVPVIVEALTDNKNRTVQDLRSIFQKGGGQLGEQGSVQWMFDRVASVIAKAPGDQAPEDPEEVAIMAGANEVQTGEDGELIFFGDMGDLDAIQKYLSEEKWDIQKAELIYKAKNPIEVADDSEEALQKFLERVDDHDDVKRLHLGIEF